MDARAFLLDLEPDLIALRHEFHQSPEVGLHLPATQARLLRELEGLPLEVSLGEQVTSIVAVLRGRGECAREPRAVLLRGDMDGLPVTEATGLDWASTNGAMHACGHDLHMTMLVGAVKALCAQVDELPGDVVFMFQPGEEGCDGASYMITEGVLDAAGRPLDAAYALHVWSSGQEPCGTFTTKPGAIMASSDIAHVRITGRGGHGSAPHLAADPVPAMAEMITATHAMVTRRFDVFDPVVVTVGQAHAGTIANVIPETASFDATLRAFSTRARDRVFRLIPEVMAGIASAHGLGAEVTFTEQYPVTVNHDAETDWVAGVVEDLFGADAHVRWTTPLTAAEDFSRVLQAVPGSFIGLQACPPELDHTTAPFNHSAYARFDDSVLMRGALLLAELASRTLSGR